MNSLDYKSLRSPLLHLPFMKRDADLEMPSIVQEIRQFDFSCLSDSELRHELDRLRTQEDAAISGEILPCVYAIVNEAIKRRLGFWRIFYADFPKGALAEYETLARYSLESQSDWKEAGDFLELDPDEQIIVETIIHVAERSRLEYWCDIDLPADFYRAVQAKDAERLLRFEPTDEQLMAGCLLWNKTVVEMDAGEGKTVAAAFPTVLHAVSGRKVHIVTSNDYLASRDAELLAPVYESLGLSVGYVLGYMSNEERRYAYSQDIVYGTLREFAFDFLRDNLRIPPDAPVQGKLEAVIVDEADHTLIDQASTPLIISGEPQGNSRTYKKMQQAIESLCVLQAENIGELEHRARSIPKKSKEYKLILATLLMGDSENSYLRELFVKSPEAYRRIKSIADDELQYEEHQLAQELYYVVDLRAKSVSLTEKGYQQLQKSLGIAFDISSLERQLVSIQGQRDMPLEVRRTLGDDVRRRIVQRHNQANQLIQMLRAYTLLQRDVDYLVVDGRVVLLDELTGRPLPNNVFQQGLHAAIEGKEGFNPEPEKETLAQISVQGFISLYAHASGMTGSALGAKEEFQREYRLAVQRVPSSHKSRRRDFGTRIYPTRTQKLDAILEEIELCHRIGRPVLVATLTIEQSEELSELLREAGIPHNLLNAVNTASEEAIIRNAGTLGAVTIATNMAGRGTDIILSPDLSKGIVKRYVRLVHELVEDSSSQVEIRCASDDEARLLYGALMADDSFAVRFASAKNQYVITVGNGDDEASIKIEFGLGLYVIGTELNASSRIDQQLMGRSGRQGEFGASCFIHSLEDDLIAFSGDEVLLEGESGGAAYVEGARADKLVRRLQSRIEQNAETQRSVNSEYIRIQESITFDYYKSRRQIVQEIIRDKFYGECASLYALDLVKRHFPDSRIGDYLSQLDELLEELWLDTGLDCSEVEGIGIPLFTNAVGEILLYGLVEKRAQLGEAEFDSLAQHLFLQTSDELWRDFSQRMRESVLSASLSAWGHKAAVAEYAIKCVGEYRRFQQEAKEAFLLRLLAFPIEELQPSNTETEVELAKDVVEILS